MCVEGLECYIVDADDVGSCSKEGRRRRVKIKGVRGTEGNRRRVDRVYVEV